MEDATKAINDFLHGDFGHPMEEQFVHVLETVLGCKTPMQIGTVLAKIADISNLTEERFRMPLLDWPWLDGFQDVRDKNREYDNMADVLEKTRQGHLYVHGNRRWFHNASLNGEPRYFLAKNEDFHAEAPPHGRFQKWYGGGTGQGLTLTRVPQPGDSSYSDEIKKKVDEKLSFSGLGTGLSPGYWNVRPEIAVTCAFATDWDSMCRMAISAILSIAFVQAVSVSRGATDVKCDSAMLSMSTKLPIDTVGGQIAVLAAVYARLMSPRGDEVFMRGKLGVRTGIFPIDPMKLSNNLYWLAVLWDANSDIGSVKTVDGNAIHLEVPSVSSRKKVYRVTAVENALFFVDMRRTVVWLSVSVIVIVAIAVSVAFQDIEWAEKLEKFLNLLFTVLIATVIGLASIHTEENLLRNVMRFRRRIADVSDFSEQLFSDVVAYIENEQLRAHEGNFDSGVGRAISSEQSSWVSEYNRGETKLGRPVLLTELSTSTISISGRFELSLFTNGQRRNLHINPSGTCTVSGPSNTTNESKIFLRAPVRLG